MAGRRLSDRAHPYIKIYLTPQLIEALAPYKKENGRLPNNMLQAWAEFYLPKTLPELIRLANTPPGQLPILEETDHEKE